MKEKTKMIFSIKGIAIMGVLCALYALLSVFEIKTLTNKYSLSFLAVAVAAMLYGPVGGIISGMLGDIIGYLIHPTGAFFPGFTVTAALTGLVFGLLLFKKDSIYRTITAAAINCFIISLVCNTYLIAAFFSPKGFAEMVVIRTPQCIVMFIAQIILITIVRKLLIPHLKRIAYDK